MDKICENCQYWTEDGCEYWGDFIDAEEIMDGKGTCIAWKGVENESE